MRKTSYALGLVALVALVAAPGLAAQDKAAALLSQADVRQLITRGPRDPELARLAGSAATAAEARAAAAMHKSHKATAK